MSASFKSAASSSRAATSNNEGDLAEIPEATVLSQPSGSARNSSGEGSELDAQSPSRVNSKASGLSSLDNKLERKPTLEPNFIKTLQDDPEDPEDKAEFDTGAAPMLGSLAAQPSTVFTSTRKTGFESWARSDSSARTLFVQSASPVPVLVFRDMSVKVAPRWSIAPPESRNACANCSREWLDLGVDSAEGFTTLHDVSGSFLPGQMTLLIGLPGCGKTTLLRTLAGRQRSGELVLGSFKYLGEPVDMSDPLQRRRAVLVTSDDSAHIPNLTVKETLKFAADLCATGDEQSVREAVDKIIESLGLSEVADTIVGGEELRGISGGQKRRVSLGEMMFSREARMLLLDQITDGLDSAKAAQVMRIVRSACRVLGFSACVALLQPTDHIFDMFDNLMVLSPDGGQAFFGPSKEAVLYFETVLASCGVEHSERPVGMSSCEFILMACTHYSKQATAAAQASSLVASARSHRPSLPSLFAASRDGKVFFDWMQKQLAVTGSPPPPLKPYAHSFGEQLLVLCRRRLVIIARNPVTVRRLLVAVAFGLVLGTLFSALRNDLVSALARCGFLFLTIFLAFMLSAAVTVPDNFRLRQVFFKQHGARFHSSATLYLAHALCDAPLAIFEAFVLTIIPYFWVGLRTGLPGGYGYFFAVIISIEFIGQAISRVICAVAPSEVLAIMAASAYILICGLVAGFMPAYAAIGWWWRWLSWITPVAYAYEGLVVNQYLAGNVTVYAVYNANGTGVGALDGQTVATIFGLPRVPFANATAGLNTPLGLMGFDVGLIFLLAFLLDGCGLMLLRASHRWYEPATRQVKRLVRTSEGGMELFGTSLLSQFTSLTKEMNRQSRPSDLELGQLADPLLGTTEGDMRAAPPPASPSSPPKPMSLQLVELSYFVPKGSGTSCMDTVNQGSVFTARIGQDTALSIQGLYTRALQRLGVCGTHHVPANDEDMDILPPEERLGVTLHRPKDGGDNGGGGRARAWSNKLPMDNFDAGETVDADRLQLLHGVTANFKSGTMTALLGESGSGKTTLMDVVAGYKSGGSIEGDVFVSGTKVEDRAAWRTLAGYAEQNDLHCPYLSVYESLFFAARCRMPRTATFADVHAKVNSILKTLSIAEFKDYVLGREGRGEGVPKHVRKRVTVGVELVASPRILFLDEPTTGLDAVCGEIVVEAIRTATRKLDLVTLATVHQPSRSIFAKFDCLLLLQRGGRVLYHGKISSFSLANDFAPTPARAAWLNVRVIKRQVSNVAPPPVDVDEKPAPCVGDLVLAYFGSLGAPPVKQGANPADHIFTCLTALQESGVDAAELYEQSDAFKEVWAQVNEAMTNKAPLPDPVERASFCAQLALLTQRHVRSAWRDPGFIVARFSWTSLAAMFIGTVFFNLGCGLQDMVFRIAALFFSTYVAVVPMQVAIAPLVLERAVVYREAMSGTYSQWANGLSRVFAEAPFHAFFAVVYYAIFYYTVGLQTGSEQTGYFIVMLFLGYWLLTSFGQLLALVCPNIESASGLAGLIIILSTMLMGFLVPISLMPPGWAWAPWVNMLYYMLQGFCVNELSGLSIVLVSFGNYTGCAIPPGYNLTTIMGSAQQSLIGGSRLIAVPPPSQLDSLPFSSTQLSPSAAPTMSSTHAPSTTLTPTRPTRPPVPTLSPTAPTSMAPTTTQSPTSPCDRPFLAEFVQTTESLFSCMLTNDCIQFTNGTIDSGTLTSCFVSIRPPPPPCSAQQAFAWLGMLPQVFDCGQAISDEYPVIGIVLKFLRNNTQEILTCIDGNHTMTPTPPPTALSTNTLAPSVHWPVGPNLILCLLEIAVPQIDRILQLLQFLIKHQDIIAALFGVFEQFPQLTQWLLFTLETGQVRLPATVILYYFQWAQLVPNNASCTGNGCTYSIVANTQWYYCLFAIGMFLVGVELFKLLATRYVSWIKR